jgi:hypothetical protein
MHYWQRSFNIAGLVQKDKSYDNAYFFTEKDLTLTSE